jgi:hypothetical protein
MGEEDIVNLQQTSYMPAKVTEPYSKVFNKFTPCVPKLRI